MLNHIHITRPCFFKADEFNGSMWTWKKHQRRRLLHSDQLLSALAGHGNSTNSSCGTHEPTHQQNPSTIQPIREIQNKRGNHSLPFRASTVGHVLLSRFENWLERCRRLQTAAATIIYVCLPASPTPAPTMAHHVHAALSTRSPCWLTTRMRSSTWKPPDRDAGLQLGPPPP